MWRMNIFLLDVPRTTFDSIGKCLRCSLGKLRLTLLLGLNQALVIFFRELGIDRQPDVGLFFVASW